ncbi:ganglioside GM2 activator-like [Ruditapes philippinarum]|uniref:ganglioside GM2 activator-like n=1 Tax=Ruditapes philippinarum TaxID=129788 RepID=UPI00295C33B8|nr:ganglioside GM2 activator-like [Ruditapes philippinarum]
MLMLILCTFLLLNVEALPNVFEYEISKARDYVHSFEIPKDKGQSQSEGPRKLKSFSWKDCSTSAPLVNVKSLSITPDPLQFPGNLVVSADVNVKQSLSQPLQVKLEMKKKELGFFITIPCIDNFGSCTYDDICEILSQSGAAGQCPQELKDIGIDCTCPFAKKEYNLSEATFDITATIIPTGEYQVEANVTKGGAEVVCLKLEFSIE